MGCCAAPEARDQEEETIVTMRRVRDWISLLLFLGFCGGMGYVAIQAFKQGDPARLYFGLDSYGNVCGRNNDWNNDGNGPDLTQHKKLYFLNPFELRNPLQYQYAKAICVQECPTEICSASLLPCLSTAQYRCPYYEVAEDGLAGTLDGVDDAWSVSYFGNLASTSVTSCDSDISVVPPSMQPAFQLTAPEPPCGLFYQAQSQVPGHGPCYPVFAESMEFLNRCLPKPQAFLDSDLGAITGMSMNNNRDRLQRYIGDIGRGLYLILAAGPGVALILASFWIFLLRYFAGFMAWMTVFAANILFAVCTVLCYQKAGMLTSWGQVEEYMARELGELGQTQDPSESDRQTWSYVAYAMSGVTGLLFIFSLIMARGIKVAVVTLKVASQAVGHMPSIIFFPIIPLLCAVGFTAYWVVVAAHLYSAGTINPHYRDASGETPSPTITLEELSSLFSVSAASINSTVSLDSITIPPPFNLTDESCANNPDCYYSIDWDTQQKYMFIYHLFSLLWVLQFIVGFGHVSLAGAVAHFYWSGGDSSKMPAMPLLGSMSNALTYHLGSIALGSFVIAVMQFVRIIFEWFAARLKRLQEKGGLQYLVCLIRGLLWLLEAILKFINRNAFIMVAVKGSSYCTSAGRATVLIVANTLRMAAVNTVGDFLIWLGKLSVAAGSGVAALLLANLHIFTDPVAYPDTYLSSPILPVAVSVLAGYTVGHLFFQVYEMAVDTIMLCFCEDCESHNGHPRYAPELLMDAIGLAQEAHSKNKVVDDSRSNFIISKEGHKQSANARAGGQDWEIMSGMGRV